MLFRSAKHNLAARNGYGGLLIPNRRRTVNNENFARHLWVHNEPVPWRNVVLPERWNLSERRVLVLQVPADGPERRQREIGSGRRMRSIFLYFFSLCFNFVLEFLS